MMHRFSILTVAVTALLFSGFSVNAAGKVPPAQAFIEDIASSVLAIVKDDALADEAKTQTLQKLFGNAVDLDWVARFVLGRHFRTAGAQQKKHYLESYRPFIIKNYVTRLTKYTGQTYKITGTKKMPDGDYLVSMTLLDPKGPGVLVDYRVRDVEKKKKFQVVDILVEGVSLITTQRSEFNAVVKNKGLDFLIAVLRKKAGLEPIKEVASKE